MSQMNPKQNVYNTAISVQPPYTAITGILDKFQTNFSAKKTSFKNIFAVYKNDH